MPTFAKKKDGPRLLGNTRKHACDNMHACMACAAAASSPKMASAAAREDTMVFVKLLSSGFELLLHRHCTLYFYNEVHHHQICDNTCFDPGHMLFIGRISARLELGCGLPAA